MNIKYIPVSDPRNHVNYGELVDLWFLDKRVEIAVQMNPEKTKPGSERYEWTRGLIEFLQTKHNRYNFALHINGSWCKDIFNGNIPPELKPLFYASKSYDGSPVVGRIQLNFPKNNTVKFKKLESGRMKLVPSTNNDFVFNPYNLKSVIDFFPTQDFIIQYNADTRGMVDMLDKTGAKFQLLFDDSRGLGIPAGTWCEPVYPGRHLQGYAGGLTPETVAENLDKIAKVAGKHPTWTDVEGGIQLPTGEFKPNGDPIKLFNSARAAQYINNILAWEQKHR